MLECMWLCVLFTCECVYVCVRACVYVCECACVRARLCVFV